MISSQDRSGWIGASDTRYVMGSWNTKTFERWWLEKLGLRTSHYQNTAMMAGTHYEHPILDALGIVKRDRQIRIHRYRLRVNLDGEDADTVYEVKTHKGEFKLHKGYWQQCQAEMFASGKKCVLIAYQMKQADYRNFFNPIDVSRIRAYPIAYDGAFIAGYLERMKVLKQCLKEGRMPDGTPV